MKTFLSKHPSVDEWDEKFSDAMQIALCSKSISLGAVSMIPKDECPPIGLFYNAYKAGAIHWMTAQLSVINRLTNVRERLDDQQMLILAEDIFYEYPDLNLADICIFLGRLRRGKHGSFYNAIDITRIMEALHDYEILRSRETVKFMDAEEARRLEEERHYNRKHSVSFKEFDRLLTLARQGDPQAQRLIRYDPNIDYNLLYELNKQMRWKE